MNYKKRYEQLKDFIDNGVHVWPLIDELGIKKDGTITPKFHSVLNNLKEEGEEGELKVLMSNINKEANSSIQEKQYYESKEHLIARKLYLANLNIYLMGPAGCGKTTFARIIAGKDNYVICSLTSATRPSILFGHFEVVNDETKFIEGPVTKAMKEGKVLILDEFDRASEEVAAVLHEVLEAREILIESTNEIIYAQEGFRVIATGNSDMQGSIEYNTNSLDLASIDRFEFIKFNYSKSERKILSQEGLDNQEIEELMTKTQIIRKGSYQIPLSTRRLIAIASMRRAGLEMKEAFEIGYLSRLPEDEAKTIRSLDKIQTSAKSQVWSFKDDTPDKVIDKVASLLSPEEADIFRKTKTCLVQTNFSPLLTDSSVTKWIEIEVKDQEGVSEEQFIK